jgi:hypothetical protein
MKHNDKNENTPTTQTTKAHDVQNHSHNNHKLKFMLTPKSSPIVGPLHYGTSNNEMRRP